MGKGNIVKVLLGANADVNAKDNVSNICAPSCVGVFG